MRKKKETAPSVLLYHGEQLAGYNFSNDHPFGAHRQHAFLQTACQRGLLKQAEHRQPVAGEVWQACLFHTRDYVEYVQRRSRIGQGFLDRGDTPAVTWIYDAALTVVGTGIAAVDALMNNEAVKVFIPIAGLHHAHPERASGFCVFNDCAIIIEYLKQHYGLQRIAYIDIDAHHGDGVYYGFASDPLVSIGDIHENGRFLFPGTDFTDDKKSETEHAIKLNIPLSPGAGDREFFKAWPNIEKLLVRFKPQFIIFQCGADGLQEDPLTHLCYTDQPHRHASGRLSIIADRYAQGRLLALGGGGYNHNGIGIAWSAVFESLLSQKNE